jgi:hypothetical protein
MKVIYAKQNGSVLPLSLVVVLILLAMGTSLLNLSVSNRIYTTRNASDITARCAADAGLIKALYEVNNKIQGKSWVGTAMPLESNINLLNCDAKYDYTVTTNVNGDYVITSTGTSGINYRTVSCVLEKQGSSMDYALFCEGSIIFRNSGTVDWYNYSNEDENLKIGTNSTNNGAITLKNSVEIEGDILVGPGGDPDKVVTLKNSAKVEGDITPLSQKEELTLAEVPEWLDSLPSSGTIKKNTTIKNSAKYASINLNNSKTVTIKKDVTLYVTGDVILGNSCEIKIEDGASLTLYLAGDLIAKNSTKINNETEIPKNLQIYGLEGCTELDLRNSCDLYGVIYTPNADIVMHNSVNVYGAIVCNTMDLKNSGNFMYDASLRDENLDASPTTYSVAKWSESR